MDTDSFVLSFTEGNVDNEHMDLSNLERPIKTNNKVPGKFKHMALKITPTKLKRKE